MKEDAKLVTLQVYENSIEAHMVKSKLESEGIECYLFDENINSLYPLYNVTVGGIKLNVVDSDVAQALELLRQIEGRPITNEEDQIIACPKCNSQKIDNGFKSMTGIKGFFSIITSFLFAIFPIYLKTVYHCKDCGHQFKK